MVREAHVISFAWTLMFDLGRVGTGDTQFFLRAEFTMANIKAITFVIYNLSTFLYSTFPVFY
jgi:hypothetical protein